MNSSGIRSYRELVGQVENPRVLVENGVVKTRGDIRVLPSERKLLEIASSMPKVVGMSFNGRGKGRRQDRTFNVEELTKVNSVDVVTSPGTTVSLFESAPVEGDFFSEVTMNIAELTVKELQENRKDLVEAIAKTAVEAAAKTAKKAAEQKLEEEAKDKEKDKKTVSLEEQVASLTAKLEKADEDKVLKESISAEIKKSDLADEAITEEFRQSLYGLPSAELAAALLKERKVAFQGMQKVTPQSREQRSLSESDSKDLGKKVEDALLT